MESLEQKVNSINKRLTYYENIPTVIYKDSSEASVAIAHEIAALITDKEKENEKAVLGLATGSTPVGVYDELVRLHEEEGFSFKNVITFNLDIRLFPYFIPRIIMLF